MVHAIESCCTADFLCIESPLYIKLLYKAENRCIRRRYTRTRIASRPSIAIQLYSATQRYTALYIIQLYSAIHYTTSTTPLCFHHHGVAPHQEHLAEDGRRAGEQGAHPELQPSQCHPRLQRARRAQLSVCSTTPYCLERFGTLCFAEDTESWRRRRVVAWGSAL